jgi:hypothetical protein
LPTARRRSRGWTADDLKARGFKVAEPPAPGTMRVVGKARSGKYNARRTLYTSPLNGPRLYDSKGEARYAQYLDLLRQQGEIAWWVPQLELFCALDPATRKPIRHRVDFLIVWADGRIELHEFKGLDLAIGKLKRATAAERYGLPILVVGREREPQP